MNGGFCLNYMLSFSCELKKIFNLLIDSAETQCKLIDLVLVGVGIEEILQILGDSRQGTQIWRRLISCLNSVLIATPNSDTFPEVFDGIRNELDVLNIQCKLIGLTELLLGGKNTSKSGSNVHSHVFIPLLDQRRAGFIDQKKLAVDHFDVAKVLEFFAAYMPFATVYSISPICSIFGKGSELSRDNPVMSREKLATASYVLSSAASVGLFTSIKPIRAFRGFGGEEEVAIAEFKKKEFIVRNARESDLNDLFKLEEMCWEKQLKTAENDIVKRILANPEFQFVLLIDGRVVAAVFSQKINDINDLDGQTSLTVSSLHDESNPIVQLLAVNVNPKYSNQRLGDQLLEFKLQFCSLIGSIRAVVGVTLCKEFWRQKEIEFSAYLELKDTFNRHVDPVLFFHQSHGARVLKAIPGYRENDIKNQGNGVLVYYDIKNRLVPDFKCVKREGSQLDFISSHSQINEFVKGQVQSLISHSDAGSFTVDDSQPFLEMGLQSSDLLNLHRIVSENYGIKLESTFFFRYGNCKKVAAYISDYFEKNRQAKFVVENNRPQDSLSGTHNLASRKKESIAIIGFSLKLPGGIEDRNSLWKVLKEGRCVIGKLPNGRFSWPPSINPTLDYCGIDFGGFVTDVESFDSDFFRITPKEAINMDPQQRLLLEQSWSCIESAGIAASRLAGSETGVYIGASGSDYGRLLNESTSEVEAHYASGNSTAVLANRISYFFDFKGPSVQIDTACSSSLVAIHHAFKAIQNGECETAVAGGVHVIAHPANSIAYYKAGMLSRDGRCKTFDDCANGYVRSEGVVLFLLKRQSSAERDRDPIEAIIRGSATNHGGLSAGLTVPNSSRQTELIQKALKDAGVVSSDLSYIEAHGTGTPLGDPLEVQGIMGALGRKENHRDESRCVIGSIKSNVGHLEAVAGAAGLLKVMLAMKHRLLPKSVNLTKINNEINFDGASISFLQNNKIWDVDDGKSRIAGVSSFGSGGANAHIIIEEYSCSIKDSFREKSPMLFVLSAKTKSGLSAYVDKILAWLNDGISGTRFQDFIYTLQVGRESMRQRVAFWVNDFEELKTKLNHYRSDGLFDPLYGESSILQIDQDLIDAKNQWLSGGDVNWEQFYFDKPYRVPLPTYPFQKKYFWPDIALKKQTSTREEINKYISDDVFGWDSAPDYMKFKQGEFETLSMGGIIERFVEKATSFGLGEGGVLIENMSYTPCVVQSDENTQIKFRYTSSKMGIVFEAFKVDSQGAMSLISKALVLNESVNKKKKLSGIVCSKEEVLTVLVESESGLKIPVKSLSKLIPVLICEKKSVVKIKEMLVTPHNFESKVVRISSIGDRFVIGCDDNQVISIKI